MAGQNNLSESNIEIDQQYELPAELDLDVFSKKRIMKNRQDELADLNEEYSAISRVSVTSASKVIATETSLVKTADIVEAKFKRVPSGKK